tara:strand:+ start:556 stop:900 length:345 start_codon:yes stop_codon:yes gene_type:complete
VLNGLMAHSLFTIKKRPTFLKIRNNGVFIRSKNINIQILQNQDLGNKVGVGFTASKKIGNAIKRNRAKRIMRELARKIIINGEINSYYVLIAKSSLLNEKFDKLLEEIKGMING